MSYDQWKTASPHDNEEPVVEFTDELKHTGRIGHGLCGKDADLDPGGQIVVKSAFFFLDHTPPFAVVGLRVYANICCPQGEEASDMAESIVCDENEYYGEWTGDYWTFVLRERWYKMKIEYPHIDPVETDIEDIDKDKLAEFANAAIFADENIKKFRKRMASLSKDIDAIPDMDEDDCDDDADDLRDDGLIYQSGLRPDRC